MLGTRQSHSTLPPASPRDKMTPGFPMAGAISTETTFGNTDLLLIFTTIHFHEPQNREQVFYKGGTCRTCAGLFLHPEITWKRELNSSL